MTTDYILQLENVSKFFGPVIALNGVTLRLRRGEVHCLLGDNGAGKSTLIKTLAGVYAPDKGQYLVNGQPVHLRSPREALDAGIATVYQDLALVPLMSVSRNFFMGREPRRKLLGFLPVMDHELAATTAMAKLAEMGIRVRDADQMVGNMSGGEKQCLAIARAIHFGASVLILDEPTAALGVKQSVNVLKLIHRARDRGISIIFITHNVNHAYPVGDSFTLLNRGKSMGTFAKADISKEAVLDMMAGGAEMKEMMSDLEGVTI
ncbi:ATP-binding cassette domain-containing protein [Rhizobacter sp. Root1221]|uniref:ATP-binding cassette domain-containing protein n=1 Tax=Rhizobacter sp. Root1221 TaxID=1736433 RepID=UPI0007020D6E|nr:ATP-binding cassette domain-containing protein [Rhizobacter sp. Root1221]KQV99391.1 ABC transporter ATP-binding protein [Rhizobacter sp. Root1221]